MNRMTGFCSEDCGCESRLDCYDGLICTWDFGAAFDKAFRHWDWRVFVIADWWLDEIGGYKKDGQSLHQAMLDEMDWRAVPVVRLVMAWRWMKRIAPWRRSPRGA